MLERADEVWRGDRAWLGARQMLPEPPSEYFRRQVYGCFFRDVHGLESLHRIGVDNVTFETDYPHGDSTWPDTLEIAREMFAGLPDDVVYKIVRGTPSACSAWVSMPPIEAGQRVSPFVGGEFRPKSTGATIADINPTTEEIICEAPESSASDVDEAFGAAAAALPAWQALSASERAATCSAWRSQSVRSPTSSVA